MNLVTRKGWGARPAESRTLLPTSAIRGLVFHYTAADADEQSDHKNCAGRVRGVQNFHLDKRGWSDIAYSFLVCKHGWVFEGRGWDVRTAATGDANDFTLACCFLGDDTTNRDDVTNPGRIALADFTRAFRLKYPKATRIWGHRDFMSTACPGVELMALVKAPGFPPPLDQPNVLPADLPEFFQWCGWRDYSRKATERPKGLRARIPAGWWLEKAERAE